MAKQDNVNMFTKGMVKDIDSYGISEGCWTHARNAINRSHNGDYGDLGNEQANTLIAILDYTVMGVVQKINNEWIVFSCNETGSEIGIFREKLDTYQKVINDKGLNFSAKYLITGVSRRNQDGSYSVYWQDGNNPDRFLNLDEIPYMATGKNLSSDPSCYVPEYTVALDTEKIKLQGNVVTPVCFVSKSKGTGQLLNGSYQAIMAYSVDGIRATDYYNLSNVQPLWSEQNGGGALDIDIYQIDTTYQEFELVIISVINNQTVARRIGFYSTRQTKVNIGYIDQSWITVPLEQIFVASSVYPKSDGIYNINGYLIRTGVTSHPDFNYQPQANKITAKWVAVSYPEDYYVNGGNNPSYMRDEVYAFSIKWIHDTAQVSASFHITGRKAAGSDLSHAYGKDVLPDENKQWQSYNTATRVSANGLLDDGGTIIARGNMSYWESSERYPDDEPLIWGENCGKNIRHHKFPDNAMTHIHDQGGNNIIILGVEFSGITHPLDENGDPRKDIIGYEILRGSREGNKSIIAKGMFNNLWEYDMIDHNEDDSIADPYDFTKELDASLQSVATKNTGTENPTEWTAQEVSNLVTTGSDSLTTTKTGRKGLYQNFPFNDLRPNKLLRNTLSRGGDGNGNEDEAPESYKKDYYSFHSPDTTFKKPYLSACSVKLYTEEIGEVIGKFEFPYKHPKHRVITDTSFVFACVIGTGVAIISAIGKTTTTGSYTAKASIIFAGADKTSSSSREAGTASAIGDTLNAIVQTPMTTLAGIAMAAAGAVYYGALGISTTLDTIYSFGPLMQYALQYNAHGFYKYFAPVTQDNTRRTVKTGKYINSFLQDFDGDYRVNNLFRGEYVALHIDGDIVEPDTQDNSRVRLADMGNYAEPTHNEVITQTSAYYGALKLAYANQYGQLDNIIQIPVSPKVFPTNPDTKLYSTGTLFGGDVYINRYTEKNPYMFFNTWLSGEVDDTEFNYKNYINGPYPRYWADFDKFDMGDLSIKLKFSLKSPISINSPANMHHFDRGSNSGLFFVKNAYFYLTCNGVRDFFVESDMNLAFREQGLEQYQKHYGPENRDINTMFRSDLITKGNYCKYDESLSISKLFSNYISFATPLPKYFDPADPKSFQSYFPTRAIYSLRQMAGLRKDNWKIYLANNYFDFKGIVTSMKSLPSGGAIILFEKEDPMSFIGNDTLKTDAGIKITIGDGGLFQQSLQSLSNAEEEFHVGSCQSKFSAVNTPMGLFYISQENKKIFQFQGGFKDISEQGMKYWFEKYLPSRLLTQFPDYKYPDNPVMGVGCQTVYDPTYDIVYFSKRDFKVKPGVLYDTEIGFFIKTSEPDTIIQPADIVTKVTLPDKKVVTPVADVVTTIEVPPKEEITYPNPFNVLSCNSGYELKDDMCVKTMYSDPTSEATKTTVMAVKFSAYGTYGTAIYSTYISNGTGNYVMINPTNLFWKSGEDNGPVNRLSIWGIDAPDLTWIGFTTSICLAQEKTVYIALAADNRFRVTLDGNLLFSSDSLAMQANHSSSDTTITFKMLHIYPVLLSAGSHLLKVEGYNEGLVACFAAEIYDNTALEIEAATSYADLTVLFTTRGQTEIGITEYTCPTGYTQSVNADCTAPSCSRVQSDTPIVTIDQGDPVIVYIPQDPIVVVTPQDPIITYVSQDPIITTFHPKPITVHHDNLKVELGDPVYFQDCSWTVSYDAKSSMWLAYHDWVPGLVMHSPAHFITIKDNKLWRHNVRTDLFCNFYGKDYPFEVEIPSGTGLDINTLRSVEYILENFIYKNQGRDKMIVPDYNFDRSIIYNTIQNSGVLRLSCKPKNLPGKMLTKTSDVNGTDILYSLEEEKYRFNQFDDISENYGEFVPNTFPMWNTDENGYTKTINPRFINYKKPVSERKKFRHYTNFIWLRKTVSNNVKMLLKMFVTKQLQSPR